MADRDLRETFDLPLMSGRDAEREGASASPDVSDAAALFRDRGEARRRPTAGEARSQARRCSRCGGVVPQGMSTCVSCGVDQETGLRVGLDDDLVPPPPPRPSGPPLHVAVVGGLLGVGALILLILSLINSAGGAESWRTWGWLCLAMVSGFGIFAVVQFLRLKSAKLLMVALTLGVVVNVLALVAMPVFEAYSDAARSESPFRSDDPHDSGVKMQSPEEHLDTKRISFGITLVVIYAILAIYLMSPLVKKPLQRANATM
jgi:hypothetical protein